MQVVNRTNLFYTAIFPPNYKTDLNFSGYVRSLSSANAKGPFDILPMHENFVTIALGNVVLVDEDGRKLEFAVGKAVIEASNNLVKVFVDY